MHYTVQIFYLNAVAGTFFLYEETLAAVLCIDEKQVQSKYEIQDLLQSACFLLDL